MPHRSEFWFFFPLLVRYAEVDQQGIVFNAHYLTYFDVGITEYFRALGYDYTSQPARTGTDFLLSNRSLNTKRPSGSMRRSKWPSGRRGWGGQA